MLPLVVQAQLHDRGPRRRLALSQAIEEREDVPVYVTPVLAHLLHRRP